MRENNEAQAWNKDLVSLTVRLPLSLELELRTRAMGRGDMARILKFALDRVRADLDLQVVRSANFQLGRSTMLTIGQETREVIRKWADRERVSANSVVVSVLEEFFRMCGERGKLEEELRRELLAARGM